MSSFTLARKVFSLLLFAVAVAFLSVIGWSAKRDSSGWNSLTLGASPAFADAPSSGESGSSESGSAESGSGESGSGGESSSGGESGCESGGGSGC